MVFYRIRKSKKNSFERKRTFDDAIFRFLTRERTGNYADSIAKYTFVKNFCSKFWLKIFEIHQEQKIIEVQKAETVVANKAAVFLVTKRFSLSPLKDRTKNEDGSREFFIASKVFFD